MAEEKKLIVSLALKSAGYKKEIQAINEDTKLLQSEFEKASNGSKDFENTLEGQKAKLKLLSGELENSKKKAEVYANQIKVTEKTLSEATKAYEEQEREVDSLKMQIKDYTKAYGASSDAVKRLERELESSEKALNKKRNAVINTDNALKGMQTEMNKAEASAGRLENEINGLEKSFDDTGNKAKDFGADLAIIGQGIVTIGEKATEAGKNITSAFIEMAEAGMEYKASVEGTNFLLKGLDQTTQDLIKTNSQNANSLGMTEKQYIDSAVKLANYQKTMGFTTEKINSMSASTIQMVADLAAVQDVPFDEAMAAYQSATKGNYEAMDKLNVALSANTLENTEYIKSLGKSWKDLSENEKMTAIFLETQRQAASATGLAAQEAGEAGMQYKLMKEEIKETTGELGTSLIPIMEPFIKRIRDLVGSISEWAKKNPELVATIVSIVAVIGGLLSLAGPIITFVGMTVISFGALSSAFAAAGGAAAFFSASILPVIVTIGTIIGIVVGLYMAIKSNWEGISNATSELFNVCKPLFDELKIAFKNLWDTAVSIYNTLIAPLFNAIGVIIEKCIQYATPIIASLIPVFTSTFNLISSLWNNILKPVFDAVVWAIEKIWEVVEPCMDVFAESITYAMDAVLKPIQWVIDKLSDLFGWIGDVGSKVGGFLSKINPFKSSDVEQTVTYNYTPALSGAYYQPTTKLSRNIGQVSQSLLTVGRSVDSNYSNNSSLNLNSLSSTITQAIAEGLKGIVLEANVNSYLDTERVASQLDHINGRNLNLYGRFNG